MQKSYCSNSNASIIAVVLFIGCCYGAILRDLAQNRGKLIGSCANLAHLSEHSYSQILGQQFSIITPENEMKWQATEPSRGQFTFAQGDAVLNFAYTHNQKVRGHNLAWGEYNPAWLENGTFNSTDKQQILKNHILTVVSHYRGRVSSWDAVNEAVLDNPTNVNVLKRNVWYPDIPNYVDLAFLWANQADPSAKLFYNDYSAEGLNNKADAIYELVRDMKKRGIPIHGVGLQYHVNLQNYPSISDVSYNIQRLTDLGLEVAITEMDVSIQGGNGGQSQVLAQQAVVYSNVLKICLANPQCTSFETWGFTDRYTWLNSDQQPLIYDTNYQPKPAYNSLVSVLSNN